MDWNEFSRTLVQRGFIYGPFPQIYGGLSGFYAYGPAGKLLKDRIIERLKSFFISHGFDPVEAPIVGPRILWEASGHVERFFDPVVRCKKCGSVYRADKLIEESIGTTFVGDLEKINRVIAEKGIRCPKCGGELTEAEYQSLMLSTAIGVERISAFLRPETATTTYVLFPNLYHFYRRKFPIKVFQYGKAFRNEISPRKFILRMREFEQFEAQIFSIDDEEIGLEEEGWEKTEVVLLDAKAQEEGTAGKKISIEEALRKGLIGKRVFGYAFYLTIAALDFLGLPRKRIRFRQHLPDEKAHYAEDAWDVEFLTERFGWVEICGVHDRGTYDLERHSKFSGVELKVTTAKGKKMVPNILEIAFGIDRLVYAVLESSYRFDEALERKVLSLPPHLAPVQVAVFPIVSKPEFRQKALGIFFSLRKRFKVIYDEKGSIGRRYRRQDELGTPFCITVDGQTLEDGTVTVRERDSAEQVRVKISELEEWLTEAITGP